VQALGAQAHLQGLWRDRDGIDQQPDDPRLNVARGTIEAAIAAGPSVSVIGLGAATGAGTNCSSCQPELAQLISAHGAQAETA
jgi:NAD(P)H-nitrite reductase large subunit